MSDGTMRFKDAKPITKNNLKELWDVHKRLVAEIAKFETLSNMFNETKPFVNSAKK